MVTGYSRGGVQAGPTDYDRKVLSMRVYEAPTVTEIGRVEELTETIVVLAQGETS